MSVSASLCIGALLAGFMFGRVPAEGLIFWCAIFAVSAALRFGLISAYRRKRELLTNTVWENLFNASVFSFGCVWGLSALWLFPQNLLIDQLFVLMVVMGTGAGAAIAFSSRPATFTLFILPAVIPPTLRIAVQPHAVTHVAAICAAIYCVAMIVLARTNERLLNSSLRLQFINLELAQELEALATRDPLTGLPNRIIVAERLRTALLRAVRSPHEVAVMFVDCDRFKYVNDTYGHGVGDEYLKGVAKTLQSAVREVDTVARLGGDEFIVLLERCGDRESVDRILQRIRHRASQPLPIGGHEIVPKLSIGVSCYPGDGTDGEALIRQADEAMYAAKRSGGDAVRYYLDLEASSDRPAQPEQRVLNGAQRPSPSW